MKQGVRFFEVDSLEAPLDGKPVIEQLDALYMTRIQKEHDVAEDVASFREIDFDRYRLNRSLVRRMKAYAPILHPFPRDQHFGEIPHEVDNDPRAMYFRQARNGMWARAAALGLDLRGRPSGVALLPRGVRRAGELPPDREPAFAGREPPPVKLCRC